MKLLALAILAILPMLASCEPEKPAMPEKSAKMPEIGKISTKIGTTITPIVVVVRKRRPIHPAGWP